MWFLRRCSSKHQLLVIIIHISDAIHRAALINIIDVTAVRPRTEALSAKEEPSNDDLPADRLYDLEQ